MQVGILHILYELKNIVEKPAIRHSELSAEQKFPVILYIYSLRAVILRALVSVGQALPDSITCLNLLPQLGEANLHSAEQNLT